MTSKMTVAEFVRKLQQLLQEGPLSEDKEMEFRFYFEVIQKIAKIDIGNIIPLSGAYPIENVQKWAIPLDMHVVEGGSGIIYLSWSKSLDRQ